MPNLTNTWGYQLDTIVGKRLENTQPWKRHSQKMVRLANALIKFRQTRPVGNSNAANRVEFVCLCPQRQIQDFGQGGIAEFSPGGAPSPKFAQNCLDPLVAPVWNPECQTCGLLLVWNFLCWRMGLDQLFLKFDLIWKRTGVGNQRGTWEVE